MREVADDSYRKADGNRQTFALRSFGGANPADAVALQLVSPASFVALVVR